jgi:hypothetical protein
VIAGPREPHSVVFHGGVLHVLSSASGEYFRQREDGPFRRRVIGGYLRGLCIDDDRILIGRSASSRGTGNRGGGDADARKRKCRAVAGVRHRCRLTGDGRVGDDRFQPVRFGFFDIVKLPAGFGPPRIFDDPVRRRVASLRDAQYRLGEELKAVRETGVPTID